MLRNKKRLLLVIMFFCCFIQLNYGQQKTDTDTITAKNFKEFYKLYFLNKKISEKKINLNKWILKNKLIGNVKEVMTGYQVSTTLYYEGNLDTIFKYCDSILDISKGNEKYNFYSSSAYYKKGNTLYFNKDYKRSLMNYLLALRYTPNDHMSYRINYSIAMLKDRVGEYYEALTIYKKNYSYAKKKLREKTPSLYLSSMYGVANAYNNVRKIDSASFYNQLGIKESMFFKEKWNYNYFVLNQGTTHYLKREFNAAIDSLKKSAKLFKSVNDGSNEAESYYYLGQSYAKLGLKEKAVQSFKKVDEIFRDEGDLFPTTRESYEYLIDYYKNNNDDKNQLVYIKQLIKLDSVLHTNELYLNKNLIKEYDIPRLIDEKEKIISRLSSKQKSFWKYIYGLITVLVLSMFLLFYQNKKRKLYKKRFEEIIEIEKSNKLKNTSPVKKTDESNLNIPKQIVENVLAFLVEFESKKQFISREITLQSLAKKFETNTSYLSKIINEYKKTSFTKYINNLRIEFAIEELTSNSIFRKYTIKAIAEEVGFNNSESFSKAFYKSKGIQPSFFIKELKKLKIA